MSKLAEFFWRGKKPPPKPLTEARIRAIVREEIAAMAEEDRRTRFNARRQPDQPVCVRNDDGTYSALNPITEGGAT